MTQKTNSINKDTKAKFYIGVNNYFNDLKEQISKKIDINQNYEYVFSDNDNNNNINVVEIYLNDKLKLKAEYNIVGLYNIPLSTWYWGWNIAFVNKNLIKNITKIKDFVNTIEKDYDKFNKIEAEELHYVLSNDNFYVSGDNLDKIIKIALYLTKAIWYFPIKYSDHNAQTNFEQMDKIEYILITKILQFN